MIAMVTCHDAEGWEVVSDDRDFDTTLCFEEGIILSTLLGFLLVSSLLRSFSLVLSDRLVRSSRSLWVLRVKIVRIVHPLKRTRMIYFEPGLASCRLYSKCN
jgi:hypothetical protein